MKNGKQISLFDTIDSSVSTVVELRVAIYAPIVKITNSSIIYKNFIEAGRIREIETEWGKVKIKGNILTQIHRDIVDAIFATAQIDVTPQGRVSLMFSAYEIQVFLGRKSVTNNAWLKKKLDEIKTTNIEYVDTEGNTFDFNITDSGGYSQVNDSFKIVFTEGYMNFFQTQDTIGYKDEIKKLTKIEDPLIKAMIRHFFSYPADVDIALMELLKGMGLPIDSDASKKRARKAIREHIEELKEFNITVDLKKWIFTYSKLESVAYNHAAPVKLIKKDK